MMMTLTHWSIQHVENMHHTQERKKHNQTERNKAQQKQDKLEVKRQQQKNIKINCVLLQWLKSTVSALRTKTRNKPNKDRAIQD